MIRKHNVCDKNSHIRDNRGYMSCMWQRSHMWIYNYLCILCLSPLMLWVWILFRARCTALCDKVCQWLVAGRWFSPGTPVSSTNKTDRHDITEILLKVALNTIKTKQWKLASANSMISVFMPFSWLTLSIWVI
jgi:hypothetical protein